MNRRRVLASALAAALAIAAPAFAQSFPARTVTFVVPYSPGGLPDTVARLVGQNQPVHLLEPAVQRRA